MAAAKRGIKSAPIRNPAPPLGLPIFIEPMLATPGEPFNSPAYLFEPKWDGTRALCFVDGKGKYRLVNRRRRDIAWRYPELSFLGDLPRGTVLDGEIVCLGPGGKPSFAALQSREQVRTGRKANHAAKACPSVYMVFDQLFERFGPVMGLPCHQRRELLRATVATAAKPRLVMSEGVVGHGRKFFAAAEEQGLEGVVAKRLDSPYLPGKRTDAWVKIKRHEVVACVVIGFVPEGQDDFGSLILAAQVRPGGGELRCVGRVGSGFDARLRGRINRYLYAHVTDRPVIACREKGLWVEPGLYCTVRCMERTADGRLRAPVFGEITHVQDEK